MIFGFRRRSRHWPGSVAPGVVLLHGSGGALLDQLEGPLASFIGDGADASATGRRRGAAPATPPEADGPWTHHLGAAAPRLDVVAISAGIYGSVRPIRSNRGWATGGAAMTL
ncbi:MAG: hypothetical protein QOF70_4722 [Acetobacteraceae bacterium]|jgi:hypothetical protein|nr:hypothetical protein [Acetobacteraceae bacterium]